MKSTPVQKDAKASTTVHDRIDQLEKLVTSLMGSKGIEHGSPAFPSSSHVDQYSDDSTEVPGTPDRVKLNGDATSYTNSGHWTSILDGVSFSHDIMFGS